MPVTAKATAAATAARTDQGRLTIRPTRRSSDPSSAVSPQTRRGSALNRLANARKGSTSATATSTMAAPTAVMTPKSWTGPTWLAMSAPNPTTSVAIAPQIGQSSVARVS